jgi:hypothetical protein
VPDLQAQVPQATDQVLDRAQFVGTSVFRDDDQDVDVRVREQFAAAIAADRDDRRAAGEAVAARQLGQRPVDAAGQAAQQPLDRLAPGMIFTVEPMINAGRREIRELADGWTIVTKDHSLSAQWEHTVLVTETGYEVLTVSPQMPAPARTACVDGRSTVAA